jgi:hypothetical protein
MFYGELFATHPTPKQKATPCHLSVIGYLIHLQLSSIPEGHLLHPQSKDMPGCSHRDPHNIILCNHLSLLLILNGRLGSNQQINLLDFYFKNCATNFKTAKS